MHIRHGVTHDLLACWFGADRSTITRAIGEVRPLLAERGCTVSSGVRLRTLAQVIHLGAGGKTGIIDGHEIRVRRPAAGRKDRDRFISGKTKQNAVKTMGVTDGDGQVLFCSPTRPGSCADITHARQLGLVKLGSAASLVRACSMAVNLEARPFTPWRAVKPVIWRQKIVARHSRFCSFWSNHG
ncbi:transposase family protein [Streptomyces galbus]|uniref:transposase family protein n=1 Tax=Streptomyces galbus TaxID=33898 RepID=UPI00381486E4